MKFRVLFCVISLIYTSIYAQKTFNSPYSRYGLGEIFYKSYGQSNAMGGATLGIPSMNHLHTLNPASLTWLPKHNFLYEIGLVYRLTELSNDELTQTHSGLNAAYFNFGFPINKYWATSIGLSPFSNVSYKVINTENRGDAGTFQNQYNGSGGINQVFMQHSFRLFKGFSVGVNAAYLFGPLNHETTSTLQAANYVAQMKIQNKIQVSDFAIGYGAQYYKILKDKYGLGVGFIFEPMTNIHAVNTTFTSRSLDHLFSSTYEFTYTDTLGYDTLSTGNMKYPSRIGLGLCFTTEKFLVAVDYMKQTWSESNFFGKYDDLVDNYRLSGGLEFIPNFRSPKYLKTVRYRIGAHVQPSYIQVNNTQPKDMGVAVGFGFPLKNSKTIVNISLEAGKFGKTDNNMIQERYLKATLNLSMLDTWFVRSRFD